MPKKIICHRIWKSFSTKTNLCCQIKKAFPQDVIDVMQLRCVLWKLTFRYEGG